MVGGIRTGPPRLNLTAPPAVLAAAWNDLHPDLRAFGGPVIALSGGADSTALAAAAAICRDDGLLKNPHALHVHHHLRGEESDTDASFVADLCRQMGLPLTILHAAIPKGPGLEARARTARYAVLRKAAGNAVVATAHHLSDRIETLVLRLLRGAGPRGMAGLLRWREDRIWRPFLMEEPADLRQWLIERGLTWRDDTSNADTSFSRNDLRHRVLPELEAKEPGTRKALARLAEAAHALRAPLERRIDHLEVVLELRLHPDGFSLRCDIDSPDPDDPELLMLLERVWTRSGRRPWANDHLVRLLADARSNSAGRRRGGRAEEAFWGGGRLRLRGSTQESKYFGLDERQPA